MELKKNQGLGKQGPEDQVEVGQQKLSRAQDGDLEPGPVQNFLVNGEQPPLPLGLLAQSIKEQLFGLFQVPFYYSRVL